MRSPMLTNSGTRTFAPVSSVAGLSPPPEAVSPRRPGSVSVTAEILGLTKGPKIRILKYKNKTGYRKRQGHRQKYTQVKVTGIES